MKNLKKVITGFFLSFLLLSTVAYAEKADKISAASLIKTTLNKLGIEAVKTKFREIYAEPDKYTISHSELLALGNGLLREGKTREAIAVFNIVTEFFPKSDQAYLALGQSYRAMGLDEKDLESTNRAFKIRDNRILKDFI